MSKSDGRVVMTCELPNLGTVIGVKTFEQIIDKTPAEDPRKDIPAVTIRELSGAKPKVPEVASKSGDDDSRTTVPDEAKKPDGVISANDTSADASADSGGDKPDSPTSTDEPTDEENAEAMWKVARNYVSCGMTKLARKELQKLASEYPDTKYGKKAKKMLGE